MSGISVSGRTRVAAVIGDPVTHSLSPAIHNAAFAALGLDWIYVALPVRRARGSDAVRAIPDLGLAGMNVTMPHKADAARACDQLSDDAAALGSVNTVVPGHDGRLVGDSTDGPGFVAALREAGVEIEGGRALVLGAGGAARAVVLALGRLEASLVVAARRPEAARRAAALAPGGRAVSMGSLDLELSRANLVVNATPLGMGGEGPPFRTELLTPGHVVVDLVYAPLETVLLASARRLGATPVDGLGMLVHQAALAFKAFTGWDAPVAAMRAAAREAIADRGGSGRADASRRPVPPGLPG
ncbi:MAG: shikimate dehydrogenase [Acidimicrobiia bacterium]